MAAPPTFALCEEARGNGGGRSFPLCWGREQTVGRQGGSADIQIDDDSLSRVHCSIRLEEESTPRGRQVMVIVTDMDSRSGTFVNGTRLAQGATSAVPLGSEPAIGFGARGGSFRVEQTPTCRSTAKGGDQDWAEENRKQGIEFRYDQGRRSRSPHRRGGGAATSTNAAQKREMQRQQRKALFSGSGGGAAPRTAGGGGSEGEGGGGEEAFGGGGSGGGSANGWEGSALASSSAGNKFMRLMGAAKDDDNGGGSGARTSFTPAALQARADQRRREGDMERNFKQGMRQQGQARGRGLGA